MSADNFNLIRRHPLGGFTYVMSFASDEGHASAPTSRSRQFKTFEEALACAREEYTEYGVAVHSECHQDTRGAIYESLQDLELLKQSIKETWLQKARSQVAEMKLHNQKLAEANLLITGSIKADPSPYLKGEYLCGHAIPHFIHTSDKTDYCISCQQFDTWWDTFGELGAFRA